VCIAGAVFDQVRRRPDLTFEDLGEKQVKNIERPIRVYRVTPRSSATATAKSDRPGTWLLEFPSPQRPSIAILPFKNLTADPAHDYLPDGLRLGIQATLVQLPGTCPPRGPDMS
jgi:adenylate cyclase